MLIFNYQGKLEPFVGQGAGGEGGIDGLYNNSSVDSGSFIFLTEKFR